MSRNSALILTRFFLYLIPPALLFVPEEIFFPFISVRILLIKSFIAVSLFFYLVLLFREPQSRPSKNLLIVAVLIFFASVSISTVFSTSLTISFFGTVERMEGFLSWTHWTLFFFIVYGVSMLDKYFLLKFLLVFFSVSIIISIFGIFQYFKLDNLLPVVLRIGDNGRASSFFGAPVNLGSYGLFTIFIALFCFFYYQRFKNFFLVAALLGFLNIFTSQTRSALIGLAAGLIASLVFLALKDKSQLRYFACALIFSILVSAAAFWFFITEPWIAAIPALGRFSTIFTGSDTSVTRILMWEGFLKSFVERPFFGWGIEQVLPAFTKNVNPRLLTLENAWFDRTHNKFLDILIMQGIFGLLSFLLILFAAARNIFFAYEFEREKGGKKPSTYGLIPYALLLGFLSAYIGNHFFIFDFSASIILFFVFLVFTLTLHRQGMPCHDQGQKGEMSIVQYISLLVVSILIILSIVFNYKSYRSCKLVALAVKQQNIEAGISNFQEAYETGGAFREEITLQLINYLKKMPSSHSKKKGLLLAKEYIEKSVKKNPFNLKNRIFQVKTLSLLYAEKKRSGNLDISVIEKEFREKINEAIDLAPGIPNAYYVYANSYFGSGDIESAINSVRKILELTPDSGLANLMIAYFSLKKGDIVQAQEYAEMALNTGFVVSGDLREPQVFSMAWSYLHQIYQAAGRSHEIPELEKRIMNAIKESS